MSEYKHISINDLLNPSTNHHGNGGGPSNPQIPVAPPQDNGTQSQDNQENLGNEPLANQYTYQELGNKVETKVNEILAERTAAIERSPFNPSGKRGKIFDKD